MKINPKTKEAYNLLHNGILALARAEQNGIRVDVDYIEHQKVVLTRKINRLENEFKETSFFKHWEHTTGGKVNINSDQQLSHFLYSVKKIKPPKFTTSGKGAVDEEALKQLNIPELNILLEQSKIKRLRDVNLDGFAREQVDGYIHPMFNLHLVKTFRSSSNSPNFQNIPIRDEESMQVVRQALYARPGHLLLEVDFKGIEVSVNASINKDPTLVKYQKNPKSDMHGDMAKQIFMLNKLDKSIPAHKVLRYAAKNGFVFPQFYGDYYKNNAVGLCDWAKLPQRHWHSEEGLEIGGFLPEYLSDHLINKGIKSFSAFTDHLKDIEYDFWNNRFPVYAEWKNRWWKIYQRNGYFDTPTGFRCSGIMGKNDATNYPAQGSAFHCLLWSFITLTNISIQEHWDSRLIGQIHDSMIWDVHPPELAHLVETVKQVTSVELLKHWDWICVPMNVEYESCEVDQPWSTKKEFELKN
jgi:DNA polymerase I-like protein with 3'-5' exonuclease and polymerase domains